MKVRFGNVRVSASENRIETLTWADINWKLATRRVKNLRRRIFRATQLGNWRKVKSLMKLMIRSFSNLLVAIRRVTQINQGRKTAGIDGLTATTPAKRIKLIQLVKEFKPKDILATKRVYISKANGKFRPLSIPALVDRVKQAIILNAWEPYFETSFEEHSYGFRPGRNTHDAIEQVHVRFAAGKDLWILDADVKGAFDNINHNFIIERTKMLPGIDYVKGWLKAGYVEYGKFNQTKTGVPQGGIISPLLANISLDGIGKYISGLKVKKKYTGTMKNGKPYACTKTMCPYGYIRFADDFLVTASNAQLIGEILPHVQTLLKVRGLELNLEKTKFVHIEQGFDYLGFNVRQYHGKTIIKPEKQKVLDKLHQIRTWLKKNLNASQTAVISYLNPIIRGFSNYYRTVCSKQVLSYFDSEIWKAIYRWAKRRHPNKGKKWIAKRYFNLKGIATHRAKWDFVAQTLDRRGKPKIICLYKAASTPIIRHVKVPGAYSHDDPKLRKYWEDRATKFGKTRFAKNSFYLKVAQKQRHLCSVCGVSIYNGEPLHLHHKIPVHKGGDDSLNNLVWLHQACHHIIHSNKSKS